MNKLWRNPRHPSFLLDKGIICMDGEITMDSGIICVLIERLNMDTNYDKIILEINSPGGLLEWGLDIYYSVKYSKKPVTGIVNVHAESMAAVVLQGCSKRQAYKDSYILLHNLNINEVPEFLGVTDEKEREEIIKRGMKDQELIYKILTDRTGRSMQEIGLKSREERPMYAEEAKEFGLIDEVI